MAAAVKSRAGRCKTHVVVFRTWFFTPRSLLVDSQPVVARDIEALTVCAIGKPVDVGKFDPGLCPGSQGQKQNGHSDKVEVFTTQ